jgi:multicomponent Na+:H+ antiporter subunit D
MGVVVTAVPWGVVLVILPLLGAIACFVWPNAAKSLALGTVFAVVLSVAGLAVRLITVGAYRHRVGGWGAPLGIELLADGLSLLMLAATAVVGLAITIYSTGYFQAKQLEQFWPLWLFLLAALNALFLSADIFNLYVTLELTGLAAVALTALSGGREALIAAMRYLLATLLGSLSYLLGVVLLYHSFGSVDIAILAQRVESSPAVWLAVGLMSAGLALKTALFPLHFWLPPAHASAPAPVSAALSALVVKASFYILLRLWLEVFPTGSGASGELFGLLGVAAILWGGLQALRATRLKLLIANSTVMQLGCLFLAFPLAIPAAWRGALYLLLSHAFAKAAMFLAAGSIMRFAGHDRIAALDRIAQRLPLTLAAFALAGVSIMGLPPSGGFVAKWLMVEASLNSGQWWWALALILGSLLAAAYVFKVIGHAFTQAEVPQESKAVPAGMEWTALALASAAILLGLIAPWPLAWLEIGGPFQGASAR